MSRGILTIAYGERRFLNQAKDLARSLILHCPSTARAVATDASDSEFHKLFHTLVPIPPDLAKGYVGKLFLDRLSPFDETMFIDSDSLVVNDLSPVWKLFSEKEFSVLGRQADTAENWFSSSKHVRETLSISTFPVFNGGLYFFKKAKTASEIFNTARSLVKRYDELKIKRLKGGINEEPLYALSMSINNVPPVEENGNVMCSPVGIRGPLHINVLKGSCKFNKEGRLVRPRIIHFVFVDHYYLGSLYKRERLRVRIIEQPVFSLSWWKTFLRLGVVHLYSDAVSIVWNIRKSIVN